MLTPFSIYLFIHLLVFPLKTPFLLTGPIFVLKVCNQQQKKTISADHVLLALDKLGFGDFVREAEEVIYICPGGQRGNLHLSGMPTR